MVYCCTMLICVCSNVLGTTKNLIYSEGEYTWDTIIPPGSWVYGNRVIVKSLDILLEFMNVKPPTVPCNLHIKSLKVLTGEDIENIPWHAVLPQRQFQDTIHRLIAALETCLKSFLNDQYCGNFISQREFLLSLSRAFVDSTKLSMYIQNEENPTIKSNLRTFTPLQDGFSENCTYNQASTLTGRLTVAKGPQVLTLPKRYRDIISSRYPDGKVVQVDFVSLEPRIARLSTGRPSEDDVYIQLSSSLFNSTLSREQCKIAVLCALYGVSHRRLSKMLGKKHNAVQVINNIKSFFGVADILSGIRPDLKEHAYFRNYFGRKVAPDRSDDSALINYYVQSSAVDAAMIGFSSLKAKIGRSKLRCDPIFIIHDAMLIDIHPDDYDKFNDILKERIDIPTLGEFPVTLSTIAQDMQ
jgi:hypothetical protein